MVQVAAALLFASAAGMGVLVILAMLRTNGDAILSALAGEGAFPHGSSPQTGPAATVVPLRRRDMSRGVRTPVRVQPLISRAA